MKFIFSKRGLLFLPVIALFLAVAFKQKPSKKVLVFTKTAGYYHTVIPEGRTAIVKLGDENGIKVDTTDNADVFTYKNLKRYDAVVFFNTTGNVLNDEQQKAFEKYIQKGGGFMGVHSATDTEYEWPWYGKMVGAYFLNHPKQQNALLKVVDKNFVATKHLPENWNRWDEWYSFKNLNNEVNVVLSIDEKSYEGGKNGDNHPMAWYHKYDGGRAFYTALGHTNESYKDPMFLKHLLGGLQYAMGRN